MLRFTLTVLVSLNLLACGSDDDSAANRQVPDVTPNYALEPLADFTGYWKSTDSHDVILISSEMPYDAEVFETSLRGFDLSSITNIPTSFWSTDIVRLNKVDPSTAANQITVPMKRGDYILVDFQLSLFPGKLFVTAKTLNGRSISREYVPATLEQQEYYFEQARKAGRNLSFHYEEKQNCERGSIFTHIRELNTFCVGSILDSDKFKKVEFSHLDDAIRSKSFLILNYLLRSKKFNIDQLSDFELKRLIDAAAQNYNSWGWHEKANGKRFSLDLDSSDVAIELIGSISRERMEKIAARYHHSLANLVENAAGKHRGDLTIFAIFRRVLDEDLRNRILNYSDSPTVLVSVMGFGYADEYGKSQYLEALKLMLEYGAEPMQSFSDNSSNTVEQARLHANGDILLLLELNGLKVEMRESDINKRWDAALPEMLDTSLSYQSRMSVRKELVDILNYVD